MNIAKALNIDASENPVVSLVGGGGKTSIMYRMAEELKSQNKKVLLTTTTAIYNPGQALYDQLVLWQEKEKTPSEIENLKYGTVTVIGSHITEANKLKGIPGDWVDYLYNAGIFNSLLVEADGAKRKPIKAPDSHEPVVPSCTTHMVGVIGFDCYLKKIEPWWVHRPQILASVTGKKPGDVIDDEVLIRLVLSKIGLFKNCPQNAQKVLFINKVEDKQQLTDADRIGHCILEQSFDVKKVIVGSLHNENPVITVIEREN